MELQSLTNMTNKQIILVIFGSDGHFVVAWRIIAQSVTFFEKKMVSFN